MRGSRPKRIKARLEAKDKAEGPQPAPEIKTEATKDLKRLRKYFLKPQYGSLPDECHWEGMSEEDNRRLLPPRIDSFEQAQRDNRSEGCWVVVVAAP